MLVQNKLAQERIIIKNTVNTNEAEMLNLAEEPNEEEHYEVKHKQIVFNSQNCQLTTIRDITQLVKVEYLRSTQNLSEIMIASTSHDMRTPLHSIINMHELIEKYTTDARILQYLKVSKNSTHLLNFLVNDTLDYFQIKQNKLQLRASEFNMSNLI